MEAPLTWFRVDTGLTRHRLFVRLRTDLKLSTVALAGHLLLLWEYVAEHEPTGDLSRVDSDVIEKLASWPKKRAGQFHAALVAVGWLRSDGTLSGWKERHAEILNRRARRKAVSGRPVEAPRPSDGRTMAVHGPDDGGTMAGQRTDDGRSSSDPTVPYRITTSPPTPPSGGSSPSRAQELVDAWNALATGLGLSKVTKLTKDRARHADARIAEGLLDRWSEFEAGLRASAFHRGQNDRGWRADFAWLLRPGKWIAIAESSTRGNGNGSDHDPDEADNLLYHRVEAAWRGLVIDGIPWPPQNRDVVMGCGEAVRHLAGQAFKDAAAAWAREEDARQRRSMAAQ